MTQHFDTTSYAQRSQVETVMSMLKRNLDGCVRARTYWSQIREMALKVLTHNLMIFRLFGQLFYRAGRSQFLNKAATSPRSSLRSRQSAFGPAQCGREDTPATMIA